MKSREVLLVSEGLVGADGRYPWCRAFHYYRRAWRKGATKTAQFAIGRQLLRVAEVKRKRRPRCLGVVLVVIECCVGSGLPSNQFFEARFELARSVRLGLGIGQRFFQPATAVLLALGGRVERSRTKSRLRPLPHLNRDLFHRAGWRWPARAPPHWRLFTVRRAMLRSVRTLKLFGNFALECCRHET